MFGKKYVCMVLLAFPDALSFWLSGAARSLRIGSSFTAVLSIQRQEKLIRVIRNNLTSYVYVPVRARRQTIRAGSANSQIPSAAVPPYAYFFATAIYYFITAAKHSSRYWVCVCVFANGEQIISFSL
jgi:hypothetical protein